NQLNMLASSSISKKEPTASIIEKDKYRILSSVAFYGANASGKSNFLAAIKFMQRMILNSARESRIGEKIDVKGFRLSSSCDEQPSMFEVTFLVSGIEYKNEIKDIVFRYGFEIDSEKVHSEWLFGRFTSQESKLFIRIENDIKIGEKFAEGKMVYKAVGSINQTTLFLSLIASLKGENALITNSVITWFRKLQDVSGIGDERIYGITANLMEKSDFKKQVIRALCNADICIEDISIERKPFDLKKLPEFLKIDLEKKDTKNLHELILKSYHKKYNENKEVIGLEDFDFEREESDGSKKFFALIGPVLDALENGLVLVIDEIDARFHPNLCEVLISLFNSKKSNKNDAQLLFSTHNTNIMNRKMFRRDQIYFVEKDKYGESELYSLYDYKKVRDDASYDKDYLLGKYGAIPYLSDFESLFLEDL
ncbi:MAG: ATP-binding protein, partial [Candidatus Cloacimonadota bacterium]|nr:ATP-binding protein [Candidatus Cloacimonadota bacterium]